MKKAKSVVGVKVAKALMLQKSQKANSTSYYANTLLCVYTSQEHIKHPSTHIPL